MSEPRHFRASSRPRVAVQVRVTKEGVGSMVSYTRDIGTGGLSIVGHEGLAEGDDVVVHLSAPSCWEPLALRAKVCWAQVASGGTEVGLRFVDLGREDLVAIDEFIAALDYGT